MHLPLQSRLKAFGGSIHGVFCQQITVTDARYKQSVLRKQLCLKLCFQRRFEAFF